MKRNPYTDQIPDLQKQKIIELVANLDQSNRLNDISNELYVGIANFAPLMGTILEQCMPDEIENFFYSLKQTAKFLRDLSKEVCHES